MLPDKLEFSQPLYKLEIFSYSISMFVSIAVDASSEERAKELADLLAQYGFEKIQRGLWESTAVSQATLERVKRDLDKATDGMDRLRIFQFPMEGTLVLSSLRDKKWRRIMAINNSSEKTVPQKTKPNVPAGQGQRTAKGK